MKGLKRISFILLACAVMIGVSLGMTKDTAAAQKAPKFEKLEISTFLTKHFLSPFNIIIRVFQHLCNNYTQSLSICQYSIYEYDKIY